MKNNQKTFRLFGLQIDAQDFSFFPSVSAVFSFTILAVMFPQSFIAFLQGDLYVYDTSFSNNESLYILAFITLFSKRLFYLSYFLLWLLVASTCIYASNIYYIILLIGAPTLLIYESIFNALDLPKMIKSFVYIMIVLSMFLVYLYSFYLLDKGLADPIFIIDMFMWSPYSYLFLSLGALSFIIVFNSAFISSGYTFSTFPHIKEEIRVIISKWNDIILELTFTPFLGLLKDHPWIRIGYMIIHFLIFSSFRILMFLLFIKFGGDLFNILYLLPLSVIVFILFFKETLSYFQKVLNVNRLFAPLHQSQDLLKDLWFEYGRVEVSLSLYLRYTGRIPFVMIIIQVICDFSLVKLFFSRTRNLEATGTLGALLLIPHSNLNTSNKQNDI